MRQKSGPDKQPAEVIVKDIRRATRRQFSAEEKIRIVLEGLRGEENEPCRAIGPSDHGECRALPPRGHSDIYVLWLVEGIPWSTHRVDGKRRLAGDTARAATSDEVKDLRRETGALKGEEDKERPRWGVSLTNVAEQALELRLLKKSMIAGEPLFAIGSRTMASEDPA